MTTENTETANETQIRKLINDWTKATREGKNDAVLSNHAADVLIFDVLAPLQYKSAEEYRKSWGEWQPESSDEGLFELHELNITAGDDVAFGHCLIECGQKPNVDWVRATFGLRQIDGKWAITHQHISMPLGRKGA